MLLSSIFNWLNVSEPLRIIVFSALKGAKRVNTSQDNEHLVVVLCSARVGKGGRLGGL